MKKLVILGVTLLLALCSVTYSDVPSQMNYQFLLTDSLGENVPDGNYSVTFVIFDDSIAGDTIWSEGRLVAAKDGLISTILGEVVPIPDSAFLNSNRWLGIQIGLDSEILPRTRFTSLPYAFHSLKADVATSSLDKTIDASELTLGSLDTARFSALEDLVSESAIGAQSGQLAEGDHNHTILGVRVIQDTTSFDTLIFDTQGELVMKTFVIPSNTFGSYFTVYWSFHNAPLIARVRINGELIGNFQNFEFHSGLLATWVTRNGDVWLARSSLNASSNRGFFMDITQENTITITAEATSTGNTNLDVGTAWIELGPK